MFVWKLLTADEAKGIWDKSLESFEDCSPFQSYAFGQYQRQLGWAPCHWAAINEAGKITALCLGLLRRYPLGFGIVWCPGGPIGDLRSWDEDLRQTILQTSGLKRIYFRFRCDRERKVADALFLNHRGWSRSISPMTSSFTMELDLTLSEDELMKRLHSRWRRNLRLASQNELKIELRTNPDIDEVAEVFSKMEARKQLPQLFPREKLQHLFDQASSNLVFYRCEDRAGDLISFRASLISGSRAVDYLAATTDKGREMRASYAVLWQMLLFCSGSNITRYDLGGIDPWANPGVYTFKKDTGAREVESLGEWDWSTSPALRFFGNWAISKRQQVRSAPTTSTVTRISPVDQSPLVLSGSPSGQSTVR